MFLEFSQMKITIALEYLKVLSRDEEAAGAYSLSSSPTLNFFGPFMRHSVNFARLLLSCGGIEPEYG